MVAAAAAAASAVSATAPTGECCFTKAMVPFHVYTGMTPIEREREERQGGRHGGRTYVIIQQ